MLISHRSYVTAAFDILYDDLTDYICKALNDKRTDWWSFYIYKNKDDIFDEKYLNIKDLPQLGDIEDVRKHFDEHRLLRLITHRERNDIRIIFEKQTPGIISIFEELSVIRNDWAHRDFDRNSFAWARDSIQLMINLAEMICCDDKAELLIKLRIKMSIDNQNANIKLAPREELIQFLEEKVISPTENAICTVDFKYQDELKEIIFRSRELLANTSTSEEVVNFFFNALIKRGYRYDVIRKGGDHLPTFEKVREEFGFLCFGDKFSLIEFSML